MTKLYNKSLEHTVSEGSLWKLLSKHFMKHILAYNKFTDKTLIPLKIFKSIENFVAKLKVESNVTNSTPQINTFHNKRLPQLEVYMNFLWERTVRNRDVPLDWK